MNPMNLLKAWLHSLDAQIGDTHEEIELRRKRNESAVLAREDLLALMEYLSTHELPPAALRAISSCLEWNPYAKEKD
jgi:hypothetical protein